MNLKRKCQVVMLTTNIIAKNGDIAYRQYDNRLIIPNEFTKNDLQNYYKQHLYILSDEEIKEGDWCIDSNRNIFQHENHFPISIGQRKIIATTNTSLTIDTEIFGKDRYKPLSQSFIQKYIEEYNKGNIITEVMVEYEIINNNEINEEIDYKGYSSINPEFILKVDKNNQITITKIKDSWTKKELHSIISQFEYDKGILDYKNLIPALLKEIDYNLSENWLNNEK